MTNNEMIKVIVQRAIKGGHQFFYPEKDNPPLDYITISYMTDEPSYPTSIDIDLTSNDSEEVHGSYYSLHDLLFDPGFMRAVYGDGAWLGYSRPALMASTAILRAHSGKDYIQYLYDNLPKEAGK